MKFLSPPKDKMVSSLTGTTCYRTIPEHVWNIKVKLLHVPITCTLTTYTTAIALYFIYSRSKLYSTIWLNIYHVRRRQNLGDMTNDFSDCVGYKTHLHFEVYLLVAFTLISEDLDYYHIFIIVGDSGWHRLHASIAYSYIHCLSLNTSTYETTHTHIHVCKWLMRKIVQGSMLLSSLMI